MERPHRERIEERRKAVLEVVTQNIWHGCLKPEIEKAITSLLERKDTRNGYTKKEDAEFFKGPA